MNIENYADAVLFKKLLNHRGHRVQIVTYGADDSNVSFECLECNEVIQDYEITVDDLEGEFSDVLKEGK